VLRTIGVQQLIVNIQIMFRKLTIWLFQTCYFFTSLPRKSKKSIIFIRSSVFHMNSRVYHNIIWNIHVYVYFFDMVTDGDPGGQVLRSRGVVTVSGCSDTE